MTFSRSNFGQLSLASLACLLIVTSTSADEPWQQFRGPNSSGVAASDDVVMDLDVDKKLLWRTVTPETGWSSPITDGKTIWLTSAKLHEVTSDPNGDKPASGTAGGARLVAKGVSLFASALDAATGKVLHNIELAQIDSPDTINVMNSYASPTGVWSGQHLVFHFGPYGTFCLDAASGDVVWRQEGLVYEDNIGPGSSLKCADGVVIVTCDGMGDQFVAGLSLETGEEQWRTPRPPIEATQKALRSSYSTPLIMKVNRQLQAIVPGTQWCAAYDVQTGEEIWRLRHSDGFSVSCTPTKVDGKVIIATGYGGNDLVAIDPTGNGDVTDTHVLWRQRQGMPIMPSPVHVSELFYTVTNSGILYALRHEDGEVVWRQRLGGKFSSSPFASGDRVMVSDHDGNVTVFRAGEQYQEIARYAIGEKIMASPTPIGNDLLLRTEKAIYRFSNQ